LSVSRNTHATRSWRWTTSISSRLLSEPSRSVETFTVSIVAGFVGPDRTSKADAESVGAAAYDRAVYELTDADRVWNRATDADSRHNPALAAGDRALSALLQAHGLAMNGGVWHALESLSPEDLGAACAGFRHFGFDPVADLLQVGGGRVAVAEDASLEEQEALEAELDQVYYAAIPTDQTLVYAFEQRLQAHPSEFAALEH
jgi:hypothetical protein